MKNFLLPFLLFFLTISLHSQTPVPISDLKNNNSNGLPVSLGQTFTIRGIVTSSNNFGSFGPGSVQDETGGISVYGNNFAGQVQIGDSVTITAQLDQFNGLTQLNFTLGGGGILSNHGAGTVPDPDVVAIAEIINQQWNGFEEYEGKLIRINNVLISGTGNFNGGSSGFNYNISDPTGALQIRIDESVNLIGTAIPQDTVDIIGILGQFDNSAPHSTGYQLYPRSVEDIIHDGSPLILSPVFAADIDTTSFTVYFNTARNGNSQIKYGLTQSLELDSVVINDDTTSHAVPVTNLQPATLYYYKVFSANENGVSTSQVFSVSTSSNDPTLGKINVYFNFSVDHSISLPGNEANGNVNFVQKLIERINNADYSVDLALYSFADMSAVADALVLAKNRGVKVRVVYDARNTQNSMQNLINSGIQMSKRPPETQTFHGIMHNKFFIFDARDTVQSNDWIWTGSWNVTNLETGWKNNVIEINDPTLASAYLTEFEEMWGSSNDTPNSSAARFGNLKTNNTSHSFSVGGRSVKLYFSPSDGTNLQIINAIQSIDSSMYFSIFTFTKSDLNSNMLSMYNSGVTDIRGILNETNDPSSQWNNLNNYAEMFANSGATLHHKYALFDPQYATSDPAVLTGSHNWSNSAEFDNDENTLIIYDHLIANQYLQEFKKRYNEAGGTGVIIIPELLPVELISFTSKSDGNKILLTWATASEINNEGFFIEKSSDKIDWKSAGFVPGNGSSIKTNFYTFIDNSFDITKDKFYRLKQIDFNGTFEYSQTIDINSGLKFSYNLYQNFPNPFNPVTTIRFEIPYEQKVELKLFDMLGREVRTLYSDVAPAGIVAVDFKAEDLASGSYIYRIKADGFITAKKLILLK